MLGDISESPEELSSTMPERVYTRINRKILIRLPEEDDERSQKVIKIKASQWPSLVTASKGWTGCAQHEAAVVPAHRSSSASNTSPTNIDVDAVDPTQDEISPLRRAERSDEEIRFAHLVQIFAQQKLWFVMWESCWERLICIKYRV
uniref:Uncharacterized protein n=1 Tax=Parascaris univalens TaxID=6257 RepID=A0A914ZYS0_PARUN